MAEFVQQRHKPPSKLRRPREMVVACAPMRSNVNVSRIVRACGGCGISRVVCCGPTKIVAKIARDGAESVTIERHRSLAPVLVKYRQRGYRLIGLEQTADSQSLYTYRFRRKCVLVVGNERQGLSADVLGLLDDVVEIPVYGRPFSYNAATAAAMATYEYCRQFPTG